MKHVVIILDDGLQFELLSEAIDLAIHCAPSAKQSNDFKHLKKHIGAHYVSSDLLRRAILSYVLNTLKYN